MRTIKFRAWDERLRKFWYSSDEAYLLKEYDGELWLVEDVNFYREGYKEYTKISNVLIQYTGLKDKNGVDVSEGDVVKFHWFGFDGDETDNNSIGEVIYEKKDMSFFFKVKEPRADSGYNLFRASETTHYEADECIEVIGNIYENSNLLKD